MNNASNESALSSNVGAVTPLEEYIIPVIKSVEESIASSSDDFVGGATSDKSIIERLSEKYYGASAESY